MDQTLFRGADQIVSTAVPWKQDSSSRRFRVSVLQKSVSDLRYLAF